MTGDTLEPVTAHRIEETYREALALAERAQAYIAARGAGDRTGGDESAKAVYAAETLRLSTRVINVVAWTMTRKAVMAGEIDEAEATAPERRLGDPEVCLDAPPGDPGLLPEPVREMLGESKRLYERAARLQALLDAPAREAQEDGGEPAVHKLWRRIGDFDA